MVLLFLNDLFAGDLKHNPKIMNEYIKEAIAAGDKEIICQCISDVIRAKGIILLEKETGIARNKLARPVDFTAEISQALA